MKIENETPSLVRRYSAKLGSGFFGIIFNLVNASIVPRALGTVSYGNFEFLLSFFQQIVIFLNAGTSTAFYNKLSRRNEDIGLLRTYGKFVIAVLVLILILLVTVWFFDWKNDVWPKQEWQFILLAALLSYLTWIHDLFRKIVDAFGCTIHSEVMTVIVKTIGVIVALVLFQYSWLTLSSWLLKEIIFYLVVIIVLVVISTRFLREQVDSYSSSDREIVKELWDYSAPLILAAFIALIVGLADRWLLQKYAGAEEQGFYSLSFRIAGISLVFTVAMTQLIMREYSRYHEAGNLQKMRELFKRYSPMLYVLAAYFAAFVSLQAETIIWLFAGDDFMGAASAMMLMAFYPVHQTYGQMNGSLLLATGRTKIYSNISIGIMFVGLLTTWFFLSPHENGGLDAGSVGLSMKMLLIQFIGVNIQLWFSVKILKLDFRYFFFHQIGVILLFLFLAWIATLSVEWSGLSQLSSFILSGMIYSALVFLFVYKVPLLIGSNHKEMNDSLMKVSFTIKKYF